MVASFIASSKSFGSVGFSADAPSTNLKSPFLSKNTVAKSIYERNMDDKKKQLVEFKKSKIAKDIESAFPDAILTDIIDGEQ